MPSRNHVAEQVRLLLAEEPIAPGDRLPPERELAARLGVSRSSLREGLRRLTDLGIIESRQGSGTYLAPLDLGDLFDVRLRLEPLAARLAAERHGEEDLRRIDDALVAMAAVRADPHAFGEADTRAHAAIVEASASLPLRVLFSAIADLLRHSRATTLGDDAQRRVTLDELEAIVTAIRAGDADGAEAAMHRHIARVGETLPSSG
ncbi:MAG TPA: FCD domain-containing protein [Conexibacter sp.]|jgi:GntR family transcriptional repressor for pyruvate dehydrogenase complex